MTTATEAQQKTLFVGNERICQQVAYVLDVKDYALAKKLTKQNCEQYCDYRIYVCEFKKKSRGLVGRGVGRVVAGKIQYLDDICRTLDAECATPRQTILKVNRKEIRKNKMKHLRRLKPSALLLYVLKAKPNRNIQCTRLETNMRVVWKGELKGCCSVTVPFGNSLHDKELNEIYNSTYARIVKLSSLNRSYCLCDFNRWCKGYCGKGRSLPTNQWQTPTAPKSMVLTFEKSCNLCCKSCRTEPYVLDDATRQELGVIVTKLLRSGYLEQTQILTVAGMGEVFYSPYYRQLLTTDLQRQQIEILSNGTLFNQDNWHLLAGKYSTIDVDISVDAATAETYRKLRGADFNQLMKNLTMLSNLRRKNQIRRFNLNFVVQRENFREMPEFVRLGKSLGVDFIQFQRLNNLGTFTQQEFLNHCLIIDNTYLDYELWCVLQDPIFNDPIVGLEGLRRYIDASEHRYRQRYQKEQKKLATTFIKEQSSQKTVLVGKERICQQIAYVLDVKDYALTKTLTQRNYEQYRDYQIYVCEFKRKSRKFIRLGSKTKTQLNISYFDDIFQKIDQAYDANRKRHANNAQQVKALTTTNKPKTKTTALPANDKLPQPQPLWKRIIRGMKHPLRAAWHVVLRTNIVMRRKHAFAKKRREKRKQLKQIRQGNLKYLRHLKPSELLLYVLHAKPNPNIQCTRLETDIRVTTSNSIVGCCSVAVPFGNILSDGELDEIYHSTYARIVKLSSLNRSYCLCNLNHWCKGYQSKAESNMRKQWQTPVSPNCIYLSFEKSCNLCCKSCRSEPYVLDDTARQRVSTVVAKLLRSGYLEQAQMVTAAGSGEIFYSPYYRQLLTTDLRRQQITILSNGTLFNESNWRLLENKYTSIDVLISVDAATAETYQKLRGADFDNLMHNLTMLSDLHNRKQINLLTLNFLVQRDNFREMPAFVQLGKSLGVDCINFQRINNLGTFTTEEYLDKCLIIDNQCLDYDLWCVLQDPIFNDPIVDLRTFRRYIDASEKRYRKRYEREQKARRSV